MHKKLLSLAVAAATAAPAAVLADATLYGKAHVSIDYIDQYRAAETNHKSWSLSRGPGGQGNTRASRVGVKGSEDFGSGLKAIYQIEFGIPLANERDNDIDNGDPGATIKMRNSYVGLQGGFGTFLIGRHDTPLKRSTAKLELFNDRMADNEGTLGFHDVRADNTITYISSDLSGFQFAAAAVPGTMSTVDGTENSDADGLAEAYSLAAIYKNGPWYGSVAYEVLGNQLSGGVGGPTSATNPKQDFTLWRIGLGIRDLSGLYLSGIYEQQESFEFTKDKDVDVWQVQAGYKFGNTMVKGMYGQYDLEDSSAIVDNEDKMSWALGIDHSFTKRTTVYALYTDVDMDNDVDEDLGDWSGFSLGMIHNF